MACSSDGVTDIVLTGRISQARGAIGRHLEEGDRLVFDYDRPRLRLVHMLGVSHPLRVMFFVRGEVTSVQVLEPWTGYAVGRADRIIESKDVVDI
jgi:uncharacterized membrane protein (UPF0127 family)